MSIRYTDIENTGLPAVPNLTDESTERDDRHEFLSETVWSHRQETDQPTGPARVRYTDAENTGLPAVPHLSGTPTERGTRQEFLAETVWSHRQETDQPTARRRSR